MPGKRAPLWTEEECEELKRLWMQGKTDKVLMQRFKRSRTVIRKKAIEQLGLPIKAVVRGEDKGV